MRIVITKDGTGDFAFTVDDPTLPGSPPVGRGHTMTHALGDWLLNNQSRLGIFIDVDESAVADEHKRREVALAKR